MVFVQVASRDIELDPDHPCPLPTVAPDQKKRHPALHACLDVVVRPGDRLPYMLVTGLRGLQSAMSVVAEVREDLSLCQIGAAQLTESLRDPWGGYMAISRAIVAYMDRTGIGGQELAKMMGITPGQLHDYYSLTTCLAPELQDEMDRGNLGFKVARALANISSWSRQNEIAAVFISGVYTSSHADSLIVLVRNNPADSVEQVIADYRSEKPTHQERLEARRPRPSRDHVDPAQVVAGAVGLAADIDWLPALSEIDQMDARPALGILQSKLNAYLAAS